MLVVERKGLAFEGHKDGFITKDTSLGDSLEI